jgi:riboflavin synthase
MFTGLIEELGEMIKIQHGINSAKLTLKASKVLELVKLGDSIAVNGVCLTVVWFSPSQFAAEVMDETLRKTNLGNLVTGDKVNLERALSLGDRLGGHMVSGHIDGVGQIVGMKKVDIANVITIEAPQEVTDYIISKGSVAIDGISLTVVDCLEEMFTVSIIPHTAAMTTLGYKKNGDKVNLEADMIGKYVVKFLERQAAGSSKRKESKLDVNFLAENGFL